MASDFDKAVEEIQAAIIQDARKIYSEKVIEHWLNPRNLGEMDNPDGFGKVTGPCGDTMEISLKVRNSIITDAKFITDGCGTTIACGSIGTDLTRGKSIQEALNLSQKVIMDTLGGLPESDAHCALLTANALYEAIRNYLALRREPWKRVYDTKQNADT